jgi:hypothetical protein
MTKADWQSLVTAVAVTFATLYGTGLLFFFLYALVSL